MPRCDICRHPAHGRAPCGIRTDGKPCGCDDKHRPGYACGSVQCAGCYPLA